MTPEVIKFALSVFNDIGVFHAGFAAMVLMTLIHYRAKVNIARLQPAHKSGSLENTAALEARIFKALGKHDEKNDKDFEKVADKLSDMKADIAAVRATLKIIEKQTLP